MKPDDTKELVEHKTIIMAEFGGAAYIQDTYDWALNVVDCLCPYMPQTQCQIKLELGESAHSSNHQLGIDEPPVNRPIRPANFKRAFSLLEGQHAIVTLLGLHVSMGTYGQR